ncbi:Sec34-like family-domain-containing protein, partial [Fimicolochytrium jonesii]|uniref:Sec34-like family-domain-containing protein n=1 Tax=Fimicolochytrium jonesii TaxID=1396493 RepID=UPI0022FDEE68
RAHLSTLYGHLTACDSILTRVQHTSTLLDSLQQNYESVEQRTKALQNACEKLLAEQNSLSDMARHLAERLEYFNEIEPIAKFFAAPGDQVCLDDKFVPTLLRLDECLVFVQNHVRLDESLKGMQYRDAELYLMRFRQCMTRGLTLIKMHYVQTLRALMADIKEKIANRGPKEPLTPNLQLSLFYVKFRTIAPALRFLLAQLEARCENHPEYFALLGDCLSTYFQVRKSLLDPYIAAHIQAFLETGDILTMSRSGCAYVLRLCADEVALFHQFFHLGEDQLAAYLDSITTHLYDILRPLILREQRIDALSELCQTLQIYLDSPDLTTSVPHQQGSTDNLDTINEPPKPKPIESVVSQILEDAQQRLVFRSQQYIREEIEGFTPREEELAILARGRGLPQPIAIQSAYSVAPVLTDAGANPDGPAVLDVENDEDDEEDEEDEEDEAVAGDAPETPAGQPVQSTTTRTSEQPSASAIGKLVFGGGEWYPTMNRTLYILGKLYHCVPNPTFEGLAQEAVDSCRESLLSASTIITSKQTKLDGQFFLIKNLMMLREHITPYGLQFVRREEQVLDFGALREAVGVVMGSSWDLGGLARVGKGLLRGAPVVVESYADAKQAVDQDLKRVCEEFILETARACVDPLTAFMVQVSQLRSRAPKSREPLIKQGFGTSEAVLATFNAFRKAMQENVGAAVGKMTDYLGDRKTETVLVRVIKSNIVETYSAFHATIASEYDYAVMKNLASVVDVAAAVDAICRSRRASMRLPLDLPTPVRGKGQQQGVEREAEVEMIPVDDGGDEAVGQ